MSDRSVCLSTVTFAVLAGFVLSNGALAQSAPAVGANVNMVSGVQLADGDPFLTKQNEPSMAVSSVNPLHLLAGSNDYRLVDLTQSLDNPGASGDSWLGLYKSFDGGRTWRSTVVSGCPLNIAQCNDPKSAAIKGLQFASDPTVRSGPYGTFFYSFLAGNRGTGASGVVAVQRFIDRNNNLKLTDDPFIADTLNVLDTGTSGQFLDKPWVTADQPGRSWNGGATCALPNYGTVPAFNVYVAYSNFVGKDTANPHPQILMTVSSDCGATFGKPIKVSQSVATSSGSVLTVDPKTGAVYLFWRQFFTTANQSPDAIYMVKSTDGGKTWTNPSLVAQINAFDQFTTGNYQFRSSGYPTAAVSVDSTNTSRVHVAWSQRGVGPPAPGQTTGAARIVISTSSDGGATWSSPTPVDNNFNTQPVNYALNGSGIPWSQFNPANPNGYGHQIQPAMTFAAGKLTIVWLDQRLDQTFGELVCPPENPNSPFKTSACVETRRTSIDSTTNASSVNEPAARNAFADFISDATAGLLKRHTLDVFGAQASADTPGTWTSTRISQFAFGSVSTLQPGEARSRKVIRQLRFNVPNLPIYVGGSATFIGDYIDVAAQQLLRNTGANAAQVPYTWNVASSNKTVFHSTWTDNRDVVRPADGNWTNYQPIKLIDTTGTGLLPNSACVPARAGMKNQNLYSARLFQGVDAYALVNSKTLSSAPRQFNIVVQNATPDTRSFTLTAVPPAGTSAAFKLPTSGLTTVNVTVPAYSSATRAVWITSTNASATVPVNVTPYSPSLLPDTTPGRSSYCSIPILAPPC